MKKDSVSVLSKKGIIIKGAILGLASLVAVMLIFALIMLFGADRAYASAFASISLAVGTFVAAFYTAYKIGNKGYIIGLISGTAVFVVITVISLIICGGGLSLNTIFHFVIVMLSSLAGGVAGVNRSASKKYI